MKLYGTCTLPDGRKVNIYQTGYWEFDTNAWIATSLTGYWEDTQEEITETEMNLDLGKYFLHEFISEKAEWKTD